jgi:ferritin-like metal-binding protein YciE
MSKEFDITFCSALLKNVSNCAFASTSKRNNHTFTFVIASPHIDPPSKRNQGGSMKLETLNELFIEQLQDLYSAEEQLTEALPKMAKAASSPGLKQAFEEHLDQTEGHIARLDQCFEKLDADPEGKTCKGMKGLIAEGEDMMDEDAEPEVLDAGLIASAQRVEHYEIAAYGCARTYAQLLAMTELAQLLQQTLDEEKETDQKLTDLAESINVEAKAA